MPTKDEEILYIKHGLNRAKADILDAIKAYLKAGCADELAELIKIYIALEEHTKDSL